MYYVLGKKQIFYQRKVFYLCIFAIYCIRILIFYETFQGTYFYFHSHYCDPNKHLVTRARHPVNLVAYSPCNQTQDQRRSQ